MPGVVGARSSDEHERRAARLGASTAALATMIITRGTATTTVAARWALLLKRETLGRTYQNGGQRRSAVIRSDAATAMLSLCGRAAHGNDGNNNTITFVGTGPQWTINGSGCTVALPYYYCQRRVGDIAVTSGRTLLADDHEDEPIARASPSQQQQQEEDEEDAATAVIGRLLNRWDRLRCCA